MLQTSSRLTLILLLNGVPRIHFYDGDDCHELAKNFCQKYGLEKGLADLLEPWLQNTNTSPPKKLGQLLPVFLLIDKCKNLGNQENIQQSIEFQLFEMIFLVGDGSPSTY